MLHVTIKDTKTNEVIHDLEAKVIGLQAVGENLSRIRCAMEDAELADYLRCMKAITIEAKEVRKLFCEALAQMSIITDFGKVDDDDDPE